VKISRRKFIGAITSAAATPATAALSSHPLLQAAKLNLRSEPDLNYTLLDLRSSCVLRESLEGYGIALLGLLEPLSESDLGTVRRSRMTIVPGLGTMDTSTALILATWLQAGTTILLETAAGFLSPADFLGQRQVLRRHFDLEIKSPLDLWRPDVEPHRGSAVSGTQRRSSQRSSEGRHSVPYVSYRWPSEAHIRDFSRVVPISAKHSDVIATLDTVPVAVRRRVGMGTLIFLGSPLGPALRAGDLEAQSWLQSVAACKW
jgi:hypothetical protein